MKIIKPTAEDGRNRALDFARPFQVDEFRRRLKTYQEGRLATAPLTLLRSFSLPFFRRGKLGSQIPPMTAQQMTRPGRVEESVAGVGSDQEALRGHPCPTPVRSTQSIDRPSIGAERNRSPRFGSFPRLRKREPRTKGRKPQDGATKRMCRPKKVAYFNAQCKEP